MQGVRPFFVFHHDYGSIDVSCRICRFVHRHPESCQWSCPAWSWKPLKRDFGNGCVSTRNRESAYSALRDTGGIEPKCGIASICWLRRHGYILAPCHNIQPVTPVENIVAMYERCGNTATIEFPHDGFCSHALADQEARKGIAAGQTPFGACIARGGMPVCARTTMSARRTDITAHAEIVPSARLACRLTPLTFRCVIYFHTEPLPHVL